MNFYKYSIFLNILLMSKILLSFSIPIYNRSDRIKKIIEHIVEFKSNEIEIVISDNASTDDTKEVVSKFNDPRIKYFRNKKNVGMDANFILVIKRATGKFIFLLMDEDEVELETIPWILNEIRTNDNLSQLCGSIGDKRSRYDGDYAQALKVVKEKPQTFEEILMKRYLFNKNYSRSDIRFKFLNKYFNKGEDSLRNLLYFYPHGSGIVLRRELLDFNSAKRYLGITAMHLIFIGQALIAGDTLSTSKVFASFGSKQFESRQDLFKGKTWWHPLNILNQSRHRINLIYELLKKRNKSKKLRKDLLKRQYEHIYIMLLKLLFSKNIRNFAFLSSDFEAKEIFNNLLPLLKSSIPFFEGISIVLKMKKPIRIFLGVLLIALSDLLKSLKK